MVLRFHDKANIIFCLMTEDKIEYADSAETLIIQVLHLVDKWAYSGRQAPQRLPLKQGRYHLVLDTTHGNALRFDPATGIWITDKMLFRTRYIQNEIDTSMFV